ncbi:MAG: DUF692 domain-containing protein [Alphaproteobacteria bacterium]|nr:DUF692 domain-containing protein [Alphaproteobacteria bacterium]
MLQNHNKPLEPSDSAPVGIGYRFKHHEDLLAQKPDIGWIEVHPENYFTGGKPRHYLEKAREFYPLSLHAVGLSLGSSEEVSDHHLREMKELIDIYEPFQVSDHASWSASGNAHLNDLMPLPYTQETLETLCRNINKTQEFFGQQILVENPSTYIAFRDNEMSEQEFMNEAARKTGCGILLDINNIYVQAHNHGNNPYEYVATINPDYVGELHLAGHMEKSFEGSDQSVLIDTHGDHVRDEVWKLYEFAISKLGSRPTLIEWDSDIPELSVLVAEAHKARDEIFRQFPLSSEAKHAQEQEHATG